MARDTRTIEELSQWEDARRMLYKAKEEGIATVWDRLAEQTPHCTFCDQGLTCNKCVMGPCRINPKGPKRTLGVCGADADLTVARNFARFIAAGAASHSDHGRNLLETLEAVGQGEGNAYAVRDPEKLTRLCVEVGLEVADLDAPAQAKALAEVFFKDFGSSTHALSLLSRAPQKRRDLWQATHTTPRGIDRECVETLHRTHMGVDCDPTSICLQAARMALADGWGGSMIGAELSDVLFGTPRPVTVEANLGVLSATKVNILVHGHSPVVSEMILAAARDPALLAKAQAVGADGINVAGLCCTGNEVLMRQGVPLAGNHLMTELALVTGAVEMLVADYQCIMPSLVQIAACYHTRFVTTSEKARFPGATHLEFTLGNAREMAIEAVTLAIEAFPRRDAARVDIPVVPVSLRTGYSNEAILKALGGSAEPLLAAVRIGLVRGVVGIIGCNNPKLPHDGLLVGLARELIRQDVLVVVTGCATVAMGKAGLMTADGLEQAGVGLAEFCSRFELPPVLHVGSCVDNSRILALCALLADALGVDIADLPVAASAPEWYSEKAAAIGLYTVASGVMTHLGLPPNILGSELVTNLAVSGLEDVFGASFVVEPDPVRAAAVISRRITAKRLALGLNDRFDGAVYS
jgi:carbon-monoxide dehydrogenase catalytic subunit